MAIQPIDLQAIFSQLDKVGKNQAVLREGQQIQASIQQAQIQKRMEQDVQAVNQTQDMGEEAGTVKDDKRRPPHENHGRPNGKREEEDEPVEERENTALIRDPALGRNIDISG